MAGHSQEHEYVLVHIFKDWVRVFSEGLGDFAHELVFHSEKYQELLSLLVLVIRGLFFKLQFGFYFGVVFPIYLFSKIRVDQFATLF